MTLATENIALKAENARLREALTQIIEADFSPECEICQLGGYFHPHSAEAEIAANALAQPTPTTPETDKAQAVIEAACAWHTRAFTLGTGSHHEGLGRRDLWEAVANYKKAVGIALPSVRPSVPPMQNEHFYGVEAYRGGAS